MLIGTTDSWIKDLVAACQVTVSSALRAKEELSIQAPLLKKNAAGVMKSSARVQGKDVWFESRDVSLSADIQAIATSFILPAAIEGLGLRLHGSVCQQWLENVYKASEVGVKWWGGIPLSPSVDEKRIDTHQSHATGLAFSCGVDSFYSLLTYPKPIHHLIGVLGFDVGLKNRYRCDDLENAVRRVSADFGYPAIVLRTNIRTHADFQRIDWDKSHGGALATVGHLLTEHIGKFIISSTQSLADPHPCGTHIELDHFFNSAKIQFEHYGAEIGRFDKLLAIAQHPIVQRHLRVCWQHLDSHVNCGRCEKCIRTMIVLEAAGQLDKYANFGRKDRLAESIDHLECVPVDRLECYRRIANNGSSSRLQAAVIRLVARSTKNN